MKFKKKNFGVLIMVFVMMIPASNAVVSGVFNSELQKAISAWNLGNFTDSFENRISELWNRENTTDYLGDTNSSIIRVNNLSVVFEAAFDLNNYSVEYSSSGFDNENWTTLANTLAINRTLDEIGNEANSSLLDYIQNNNATVTTDLSNKLINGTDAWFDKLGVGQTIGAEDLTVLGNLNVSGNITLLDSINLKETTGIITPPDNTLSLFIEDFKGFSFVEIIDSNGFVFDLERDRLGVCRNDNGFTINKGDAVYINGTASNVPHCSLAKADSPKKARDLLGLMAEDTSDGSFGRYLITGDIEVDTSSFLEGDNLYLSDTVDGGLRNTRPDLPNLTVPIGIVEVSGVGNGKIKIKLGDVEGSQSGTSLNDFQIGNGTDKASLTLFGSNTHSLETIGNILHHNLEFNTSSLNATVIEGTEAIYQNQNQVQTVNAVWNYADNLSNRESAYYNQGNLSDDFNSEFPNADLNEADEYNDNNLTSDYPDLDIDSTDDLLNGSFINSSGLRVTDRLGVGIQEQLNDGYFNVKAYFNGSPESQVILQFANSSDGFGDLSFADDVGGAIWSIGSVSSNWTSDSTAPASLYIYQNENAAGDTIAEYILVINDSGIANFNKKVVFKDGINITGNIGISELTNCDTIDTDSNGNLKCGTDDGADGFSDETDIANNITKHALTGTNNKTFFETEVGNITNNNQIENGANYLDKDTDTYDTSAQDDYNNDNLTSDYPNLDTDSTDDLDLGALDNGSIIRAGNNESWVVENEQNPSNATIDIAASQVSSGTFADARISESSVTQHEGAIDHDALTNFLASEHFTASSLVAGSANISESGGVLSFNLSCEDITGSADLCDGDDASGSGTQSTTADHVNNITDFFVKTDVVTDTNFTTVLDKNHPNVDKDNTDDVLLDEEQVITASKTIDYTGPGNRLIIDGDPTTTGSSFTGLIINGTAGSLSFGTGIFVDVKGGVATPIGANISDDIFFPDLTNCDTIDTDASGQLSCGTDDAGGSTSTADHQNNITAFFSQDTAVVTDSNFTTVADSKGYNKSIILDGTAISIFNNDAGYNDSLLRLSQFENDENLLDKDTDSYDTSETDDYNDGNLTSDYPNLDTDSTDDVTAVTATTPLSSSGGTTPDISIDNNGIDGTQLKDKITIDSNPLVFIGNINITGSLNVTGGVTFNSFISCTALETDDNGNLVCGTDDTGGAATDTTLGIDYFWFTNTTGTISLNLTTFDNRSEFNANTSIDNKVDATFVDNLFADDLTVDDDVPESGDFGNAADLESDGSLSASSVSDNEIDYATVTLADFTNDINFINNGSDANLANLNVFSLNNTDLSLFNTSIDLSSYYNTEAQLTSLLDDDYVDVDESPSAGDISGSFSSGLTIDSGAVQDAEIDYNAVTLTDFTNDVGYLINGTDMTGGFNATRNVTIPTNNSIFFQDSKDKAITGNESCVVITGPTSKLSVC